MTRVAVVSRSFSHNPALRAELLARHPEARFSESSDVLDGEPLVRCLRGHDAAIVGLERITEEVLSAVPELRVVSKYGVGLDGLDLAAMARRGVRLAWTGGVNRRAVAELTVMFATALLRRVPASGGALKAGRWEPLVGRELTGTTVGIIGCGHVGKDLVTLLGPYACRVLAHDIREYPEFYRGHGVTPVGIDALIEQSDVVTLHVPLDRSTRNIMSAARLAAMRPGAVFINAARGGLVDEAALADALESGRLAGAAMDVFDAEPAANPRLLALPTFWGTPHVGGSTTEAQLLMGRAAIRGLDEARPVGGGWPG